MPTPILNQVSKDLAYKLQDPVSSGTANGQRLSAAERLRYIIRAYRRLLRLVTILYPGLIQKLFHNYYLNTTGTTNASGQISDPSYVAEVYNIYCKEPTDENYTKAEFIPTDLYLDVESGQNSFYVPDLNTDKYYWSRVSNDIYLLPAVQLSYKMSYRNDRAQQIEDTGQGGAYDLDIPTEHSDLLLSLAAAEAYLDIGQADLVSAYKQDVAEQLSVLAGISKQREQKDTDEEP